MHADRIVHGFVEGHLKGRMHEARRRLLSSLLLAVVGGTWLVQSQLARTLAGEAGSAKQAMKRVGRWTGNERLESEAQAVGAVLLELVSRWSEWVVVAVDWTAASPGGEYVELRASVTWPGAGRALAVYQRVYPLKRLGDPRVERELLLRLSRWLERAREVVVVTDAGFRRPWFEQVEALGWGWIGRVRSGVSLGDGSGRWAPAQEWMQGAGGQARRSEGCRLSRAGGLACAVVRYRRPRRHRRSLGVQGRASSHKAAREARAREREPWLLVHAPRLSRCFRPQEIVALYARRMQIEENIRDSKSPVFGMGYAIGRARTALRLQGLLLLGVLAGFLLWHIGQLAEAEGLHRRLRLTTGHRRELSYITLGRYLCSNHRRFTLTSQACRCLLQRLGISRKTVLA